MFVEGPQKPKNTQKRAKPNFDWLWLMRILLKPIFNENAMDKNKALCQFLALDSYYLHDNS